MFPETLVNNLKNQTLCQKAPAIRFWITGAFCFKQLSHPLRTKEHGSRQTLNQI